MCIGRLFSWGQIGRDVKLTTSLHLVPRSRMVELYLHSPMCLHGVVLNYTIRYRNNFMHLLSQLDVSQPYGLHGLLLFQHFAGGTEKTHEKPHLIETTYSLHRFSFQFYLYLTTLNSSNGGSDPMPLG
jgi:hypothetical protein